MVDCWCRGRDEAEQGMSMVHVGVEGRGLVGSLAFRDTLRPDARQVVQRLKQLSIRVALLSGDNAAAVTAAAQQAGIQVHFPLCHSLSVLWLVVFPPQHACLCSSRHLHCCVSPLILIYAIGDA